MKGKFLNVLGKICIGASAILLLVILLQCTVSNKISFSNNVIDNYLHFGLYFNIGFAIILIASIVFIFTNKPLVKALSSLLVLILMIPVFFIGMMIYDIMFRGDKADERHYFFYKDGYSYYIKSERFMAYEGPEYRLYKERPLFLFVKERLEVPIEEVKANGLDPDKIKADFYIEHFKKGY
jgi:hypothetical protein